MKEIPKKNYFILIFIFFAVVIITFASANFYSNYLKKTTTLYNYLTEVNTEELSLYLSEHSSSAIYIGDKYNINNDEIEQNLKSKIIDYNLFDYFVFLDKTNLNDTFIKNFNTEYGTSVSVDKIPTLIIVTDGKLTEIYYSINMDTVNMINYGGIR